MPSHFYRVGCVPLTRMCWTPRLQNVTEFEAKVYGTSGENRLNNLPEYLCLSPLGRVEELRYYPRNKATHGGGGGKWIFLLCFLHSLSLKASAWATGFQGFLRQKNVAIFFSGVTHGKMLPQNHPCSWVLFLFRSLLKIHWLLEPPGLKLPLPHYPLSFLQKI